MLKYFYNERVFIKNEDEAIRFTSMIEMQKYKSKLKMRRTIIKMIKTKIKNGEI